VWSDVRTWAIDTASTDFFTLTEGGLSRNGSTFSRNAANDENVQGGWTAGGGAEYAMNRILSLGLEYRHNDFGDHTYVYSGRTGPIFPGSTRVGIDSDQVTFRVNFLLGNVHGP
jgi:opacity protein-like surface antigen